MATINAVNTSLSGQSGSGAFAGTTNPLFSNPRANAIYDTNNLEILNLTAVAGAVNYWNFSNSSAGLALQLTAAGTDTNIPMAIIPKGTGGVTIQTLSNTPFGIYSGTAYQHLTAFATANTAALQTITIPDATGTMLMTGVAINSVPSITFSSTSGIIGTTTNNNAAVGSVGEVLFATGGPVALTSTVAANVCSIPLTAGDWDLHAVVTFAPTGNPTVMLGGINTTSATVGPTNTFFVLQGVATANTNAFAVPYQRVSVASTTTYYLVAQSTFTVGNSAYGNFWARRIR